MSSIVVETQIRSALVDGFPLVPYFDTLAIRLENEQLPALWQTMDFIPQTDSPVSIGSPACRREIGIARAYAVTRTGGGELPAVQLADATASYFRKWRWNAPGESIRVDSVIPVTRAQESDGRWLIVFSDVQFVHDYYY